MTIKVPTVKKYIVRLSKEERKELNELIRKGKSQAKQQLKARILLKADVSKQGEGWSDSKIIKALNTSASMVYRVRQQLVEEGIEAVLSRKQRATPAIPQIFDGEKEARLIQLACSEAPAGQARWTLNLLANKVVALKIVDTASPSTVGRVLKKHAQAPPQTAVGHPAGAKQRICSGDGRCAGNLHASARS
ncbi:MAG: helix-turn-helix domain-containing protein [Alphaproteobacteria bacterium]|nr:helix-turn-helix domain-containing protein [Alphaproteobacteria bacterium]